MVLCSLLGKSLLLVCVQKAIPGLVNFCAIFQSKVLVVGKGNEEMFINYFPKWMMLTY
jgi:hypothetical protein